MIKLEAETFLQKYTRELVHFNKAEARCCKSFKPEFWREDIRNNIGAGGLGGLTEQLMTLPGLGTIAGTGLQAYQRISAYV